jgi:hypothetical protein
MVVQHALIKTKDRGRDGSLAQQLGKIAKATSADVKMFKCEECDFQSNQVC